jgi:hypothetical protein
MKKYLLVFLVVTIILTSCKVVGTLHSISENENDFLFKKELIGKWKEAKTNSDYYKIDTVKQSNGKLYRVMIVSHEKGKINTTWFLSRLIKINDNYFLDCNYDLEYSFPKKENDLGDWLITKHFFFRLNFNNSNKIEMSFPDPDELMKLIDEKKIRLDYSILKKDDYLILNGSKELQKALTDANDYPSLYKDKMVLNRVE